MAIDILGPLHMTNSGKKYIFITTDLYSKLKKAVPITNTTATRITNIFTEQWARNFEIPPTVLTDNGPQLTSKFFAELDEELGVKTVKTTKYHQQAHHQVELFKAIAISRLLREAEHQKAWDTFVLSLTYTYILQVHRTTELPPFSLAIPRLPPVPIVIARPLPPDIGEIVSSLAYSLIIINRSFLLRMMAYSNSRKSQAEYETDFDKHVQFESRFKAGDYNLVESSPVMATATDSISFE